MIRNKKGITLVALVVTIVVLLILAGVSLNLVIGQNGLIQKAKDAKSATEQARTDEEQDMSDLSDWADQTLQGNGGDAPYIPNGFVYVGGTVDTGYVISDNKSDKNKYKESTTVGTELQGNQYVWIEVPKTEEVYKTAKLNINFETDADAYTKIENDLHEYTRKYRNETKYSDTYYEDITNEGWFTPEKYTEAKNNMLKSVYENGGFYVGRYEAGIETTGTNRTSNEDKNADGKYIKPTTVPVSKQNAYPYTYITRTQAQKLAESVNSGNKTSSLMFGVQWDLIVKYLETKGVSQDDLNKDSKDWGNYYDAQFDVTNTKSKYSEDWGANWESVESSYPRSGNVLLTTGTNEERNSKMNICDLAGNVFEWTLEYTSDKNYPCVDRAGNYGCKGSTYPVSGRTFNVTDISGSGIGFRVSLY